MAYHGLFPWGFVLRVCGFPRRFVLRVYNFPRSRILCGWGASRRFVPRARMFFRHGAFPLGDFPVPRWFQKAPLHFGLFY